MALADTFLVKRKETGRVSRGLRSAESEEETRSPNRREDGSETGRETHQKTGGGGERCPWW